MTKTMKIKELVSELNGFDSESSIKVWIRGADKDYPITDLFIDSINEDGIYIDIDDRNLVDLSKIWHDASEMPKEDEWLLIQFGEDCYDTLVLSDLYTDIFYVRCKKYGDIRWAYVSDLLPKGGAK